MNFQQYIQLDEKRKIEFVKTGKVIRSTGSTNGILMYDLGSFWVDAFYFDNKVVSCRAYCKSSKSFNEKMSESRDKELAFLKSNPIKALILICSSNNLKLNDIARAFNILKENKEVIEYVFRALEVNKFIVSSPPMLYSIRLLKLKCEIYHYEKNKDEKSINELLDEEVESFLDFQLDNNDFFKTKEFIISSRVVYQSLEYWVANCDFSSWDVDFLFSQFNYKHFEALTRNSRIQWTVSILEKYKDKISWQAWRDISNSRYVDWNKELLLKFEDKWHWDEISQNSFIPFDDDILLTFKEKWKSKIYSGNCWLNLLKNPSVKWNASLLRFYISEKHSSFLYSNHGDFERFTSNQSVIWSEEFFEITNFRKVNGALPSYLAIVIPWTFSIILKYREKIDWKAFCGRKDIPLAIILADFQENIDWEVLSANPHINWSINLVQEYYLKINFKSLSANKGVFWNFAFLSHFKNDFDWNDISSNESILWDEHMIDYFKDYLKFNLVSNIIWSKQLITKYNYKWDSLPEFYVGKPCSDCDKEYRYYLPTLIRPEVPFTLEFLKQRLFTWESHWESYKQKCREWRWNPGENMIELNGTEFDRYNAIWPELSRNKYLTEDIILHFKPFWQYGVLIENLNIPWSIDMIIGLNDYLDEKHFDFWTGHNIKNIFFNALSDHKLLDEIIQLVPKASIVDSSF